MAVASSSATHHSSDISPHQAHPTAAQNRSGSTFTNNSTTVTTTTEDLWSQILLSVETARSTPVCPVVILGEPQTGKSTLIRGLAEPCPSGYIEPNVDGSEGAAGPSTYGSPALEDKEKSNAFRGKRDLGLAYGYCDVPDEEGEDILARLSLFTLSSSDEALLPLLPYAFSPKGITPSTVERQHASLDAIRTSLFLITLDWERPQSFLEELRTWISVIKETVASAVTASDDRSTRLQEAFLEEMKEAVETHVRSYTAPSSSTLIHSDGQTVGAENGASDMGAAPTIVPVSVPVGLGDAKMLPLDEGVLDENLGVALVVVLTKADTLAKLERDRDYKEEQFDYIQQVLRTICLKYGAALFSTAQSSPSSFNILRRYLLHRLLPLNAPQSVSASRYPFPHSPSTVERDVLLVPSGWDSWGKIVALREGFSPRSTAQGWEMDCEVEGRRRAAKLPRAQLGEVYEASRGEDVSGERGSACKLWEDIVGDWSGQRTTNITAAQLQPPDAQAFLSQHYASLQRDASTSADPRARFARGSTATSQSTSDAPTSSLGHLEGSDGMTSGRSIVGPLQSGGLSGPGVERAMGLAQRDDVSSMASTSKTEEAIGKPKTSRRESREHRTGGAAAISESAAAGLGSSSSNSSVRGGGSPMVGGGHRESPVSSPGATKQSEVLQSFFQELLRGKSGSGGTPLRSGGPSSGRRSGQGLRSDASSSDGGGRGGVAGDENPAKSS